MGDVFCLFLLYLVNKYFAHILFPASCGIPFQVLPDYQEGAEQVSQHFLLKYVIKFVSACHVPNQSNKMALSYNLQFISE